MEEQLRNQLRFSAQQRRRAPSSPIEIIARFDGDGILGESVHQPISTLVVEATNEEGELARWLDDPWWTDVIQVWGQEALTIHIAPTNAALLHPAILHQVEMLHRVVPWWRVIAFAYADDVRTDEQIRSIVASFYDEVRFIDAPRPSRRCSDVSCEPRPIAELFGAIRFEQARTSHMRLTLVRLPAMSADRWQSTTLAAPFARRSSDATVLHP